MEISTAFSQHLAHNDQKTQLATNLFCFCNRWWVLGQIGVYNFTLGKQACQSMYTLLLFDYDVRKRDTVWNIDRFFEPDRRTDYHCDLVMRYIEHYLHNKDICLMHPRYEGSEQQRVLEMIVFQSLGCNSLECI